MVTSARYTPMIPKIISAVCVSRASNSPLASQSKTAIQPLIRIAVQEYKQPMSPKPRKAAKPGEPAMVKTTLLMPEALWRRAKVRAMEERRDLRDLLLEGLELVLKGNKGGR